jgi:starvation-inducible DNA-binding protein
MIMDELIQTLKKVLANEFAFYLKAQHFHWNVEGPDFKQYHELFGMIYEEVQGSIDPIAEEIRALDAYAPSSLARFADLADIEDEIKIPAANDMLKKLLEANEIVLTAIETCYELAEENHQHGLSNLLAERQDAHKKHGWMLRATLKD